jgi:CRISPR system Cascade subunit CasB
MTDGPPHYWLRHTDGEGAWNRRGPIPGEELAALRRGIGRQPGTVAQMWPYYTQLDGAGRLTARLQAEHLALTLFAVHQQSQVRPVHRTGVGLGTALLALRRSGRFSEEALDRRFGATATATSTGEVAHHLRGLITQLRGVAGVPGLDYTRLFRDLWDWHDPDRQAKVRRRWGGQYFTWTREAPGAAASAAPTDPEENQ